MFIEMPSKAAQPEALQHNGMAGCGTEEGFVRTVYLKQLPPEDGSSLRMRSSDSACWMPELSNRTEGNTICRSQEELPRGGPLQ